MDELEWLRKNSPPTNPSREVTQRHRTQLRAAIATEGADGPRPRRPRRGLLSRHRVLVTSAVVVVLCLAAAGVIALTSSSGDEHGKVAAPAASGSTSTTAPLTCPGPLPKEFNIPVGFVGPVAGPAEESSDPVEPGQQVMHWSSDKASFEIRWPAGAEQRKKVLPQPQVPGDENSSASSDLGATVDSNGFARRNSLFAFPGQVTACQTLDVTLYSKDEDLVNALAAAFNDKPYGGSQPLVTSTRAAAAGSVTVAPCPGPVDTNGDAVQLAAVKYVPTVGGSISAETFTRPEDALADFLAIRPTLFQRGYQELQLADGSVDFAVEPRPGIVVTLVHVTPTKDGWTTSNWSASGC